MIMDMRLRPPLPTWIKQAQFEIGNHYYPTRKGFLRPPSAEKRSLPLLLQEMDAAGISLGVVMGRQSVEPLGSIPNDEIAECIRQHPTRFVGWAGIDLAMPMDACLAEINRCVRQLKFKGVSIEPTISRDPSLIRADDRRLYPIYEECLKLDVPINITLSAALQMQGQRRYEDSTPNQICDVARDFPKLDIHIAHAGWPMVMDMIGVAFIFPNVWVSPDQYLIKQIPGALEYVTAANNYFEERTLFGSSYPSKPLAEMVQEYRGWNWKPGVLDAVFSKNALRLMRMA